MNEFNGFPAKPPLLGQNPFADIDPYAAPGMEALVLPGQTGAASPYAGLWRQGNLLVMHKQAPFPDICLKSNQPATRRLKRKLSWHHPAIYLVVLLHVVIYIVVALIVRKTATIHIPLSEDWFEIRLRRLLFAWGIVLASLILCGTGIAFLNQNVSIAPALVLIGGILLFLGGLLYGQYACRLVAPQRMTDDYIWLKGVDRGFLDRLEAWQWHL